MKQRFLATFLALCMALTLLPATPVYAGERRYDRRHEPVVDAGRRGDADDQRHGGDGELELFF